MKTLRMKACWQIAVLPVLLTGVVGCKPKAPLPSTEQPVEQVAVSQKPKITQAAIDKHSLAFSAILGDFNDAPRDQLSPGIGTTSSKKVLDESWGVTSKEEFLQLLEGMESGENGHRGSFALVFEELKKVPAEKLVDTIVAGTKNKDEIERRILVATYLHAPTPKNGHARFLAWDFGRYIMLCRWGAAAGYLTEVAAWDKIYRAARLLQANFRSWEDYSSEYLAGREYWSLNSTRRNGQEMRDIAQKLLSPGGYWTTIPWDEPLGEGPAPVDEYLAAKTTQPTSK